MPNPKRRHSRARRDRRRTHDSLDVMSASTCPNCGGKVSGVRATNVHQTVPCSYCRTELHVPRVGEVVVREIVHYDPKTADEIERFTAAPLERVTG